MSVIQESTWSKIVYSKTAWTQLMFNTAMNITSTPRCIGITHHVISIASFHAEAAMFSLRLQYTRFGKYLCSWIDVIFLSGKSTHIKKCVLPLWSTRTHSALCDNKNNMAGWFTAKRWIPVLVDTFTMLDAKSDVTYLLGVSLWKGYVYRGTVATFWRMVGKTVHVPNITLLFSTFEILMAVNVV